MVVVFCKNSTSVGPMLVTSNLDFSRDKVFLWILKIFEFFRLSYLLICLLRSRINVRFLFSILKALRKFSTSAGKFVQEFFVLYCNLNTFFDNFFSAFGLFFHLLVIIVIHFCIASDAKLRFAYVC